VFRSLVARRLFVAGSFALAAAGIGPSPAAAHAELTVAEPAPNGSVVSAPERLRLTFSEPIDPETASIELLDTQQRPVSGLGLVIVTPDGRTVERTLPELGPGVFTVSYQVVSTVDGHATAGIHAFLVDPTGAAPPPADSVVASSPSVDGFTVAARWVALAALLVALGAMLLWLNAGRPAVLERELDAGAPWLLTAAASLVAALGVAGYLWLSARPIPSTGGFPLDVAAPFGWTPFAIAMRLTVVTAIAASVLCLLASRRPVSGRRWWVSTTLLLAVALAGMSMAGHVASIGGPGFAALDWAHLVGASAWLGALPSAWVLSRRTDTGRAALFAAILRRHGPMALIAAPVVALTGIANSPLVLGQGRDLVASDYGNLLVAKAVLLAVALGIGAVNHLALRGRGRAALAVLVTAEVVVAALAVSAAATMVTIQPAAARAPVLAAPPVHPAHFFGELGDARVHVAVSLPAPGRQAYRVTVRDSTSGPAPPDVQKVFLSFTPPAASGLPGERIELEADPLGGLWIAAGAHTPLVGEWGLEVIVRRAGAVDASLAFELEVLDAGAPVVGPPPDTGIRTPAPLAAAWGILPAGVLGWLPSLAALVAIALLWRLPRAAWHDVLRVAAVAVLLVTAAAAGTRTLVWAANAPSAAELAEQPVPGTPDLERGRLVYLANCAACHGTDGEGGGPLDSTPAAGSLLAPVASASDAWLSYRISYGVAGTSMPAFAGLLTADERSDLIGYLRDRFGGP
jgi:copper transport protein